MKEVVILYEYRAFQGTAKLVMLFPLQGCRISLFSEGQSRTNDFQTSGTL